MSRAARAVLGTVVATVLTWTSAHAAQDGPRESRTERVSTAADGSQADGPSNDAALSADGRRAVFVSTAPSLGCEHSSPCLLMKDLDTGEVTDIGPGGSGHLYGWPMPSADGGRVGYSAGTRFLAPYLYDSATGRAERLWPQDPPGFNELGRMQSISPDGTHAAYTIGNRNGPENSRLLYVRSTATGTDDLISPAEEGAKRAASVSGDGRRVAYQVPGPDDTEDPDDVFVRDRTTGERIQADAGLGQASLVRITADGHRVLLNADGGLYVYDLRDGDARRVAEGRAFSATADGRYAVVAGEDGLRVRDLRTGARGAALPAAAQPGADMLAAGGRAVAFSSQASHLVPGDTNGEQDVFVFSGALRRHPEPLPSVTERISTTWDGQQRTDPSYEPAAGADRIVTFTSGGRVFVNAAGGISQVSSTAHQPSSEGTACHSGRMAGYTGPSTADGTPEAHVRNRADGKLTSLGSYRGVRFTWMGQPVVDPACQYISYAATPPATDSDPDPRPGVYRFRFGDGARDVVSAPTGEAAGNPAVSRGGRYVAFEQGEDVYVRDLETGTLEKAGAHATAPSLSTDGRTIAFQQGRYIRVRHLDTGATTRLRGAQPSLSGDGTRVAYTAGGAVHLADLGTGERQLISVDRWGGRNDLPAGRPSVNADGTVVAFASASPDLVEGDTNGVSDVFLRTVW